MKCSNLKNNDSKTKLCFVVNNVAFFVSHRMPIALEAIKKGYSVYLLAGKPGSDLMESAAMKRISDAEIKVIQFNFRSDGINPLIEAFHFFMVFLKLKKINPEIIHCVSPKGVLYGGLAAKLLKFPKLVIAISGMGSLFVTKRKKNPLLVLINYLYKSLLSFILSHSNKTVIVQNADDYNFFLGFKSVSKRELVLIQGSGVDLKLFSQANLEVKDKYVLFPARMLKDKGAVEFAAAAKILKPQFPDWKFIMAGTSDYSNPSKISQQTIEQWMFDGYIDWLGHVEDMVNLFSRSSIVCLPSYREGMPKALLEAAAAGCAVVTTTAIGCKDAIIPNVTGTLVPICDVPSLVLALGNLMGDVKICREYGQAGISLATEKYSLESVVQRTMNIYSELDNKD